MAQDSLNKCAYQAIQQGKSYFSLFHKTVSSQLGSLVIPQEGKVSEIVPVDLLLKVQQRLNNLLELDWEEAEAGVYPKSILFENDWEDFLRYYPQMWLDMPQIWQRIQRKQYQKFADTVDTEGYPSYYVQNFHHQTDGYLSDFSANMYDLQVDLLFNGAADAMRRRILAPLKKHLQVFSDVLPKQIRVLDVACGTGRTLKFLRAALPQASLIGTDMSPAYLRKANDLLSQIPGELPQLVQANSEELPFLDNQFHGVTSVFLFHELPATARQHVINECFRVVKPGGVFVICDSVQLSDSPELEPLMKNFERMFHEPYYRDYINQDLEKYLDKAGFVVEQIQVHHMSKYVIASKPAV